MKYLLKTLRVAVFFFATAISLLAQNKDSVEGDYVALMDLYSVTDGDNWTNNSGWSSMTPETMGDAYGITVWRTGEHAGRVRKVYLFNNNLVNIEMSGGSPVVVGEEEPTDSKGNILPPSFRYIPIDGRELPESLGNLQQMEDFQIHYNFLGGSLPDAWYTWVNAKTIAFGYNKQGYGNNDLSDYRSPYTSKGDYNGNKFIGSIKKDIKNLVNLERLFLERNYFDNTQMPPELIQLPNIKRIYVSLNGLTGSIPNVVPSATLEVVHFYGGSAHKNRADQVWKSAEGELYLTGDLPEQFGYAQSLLDFRLGNNRFTGPVPPSYENLSNLYSFEIENVSSMSGPVPNFLNNDNMPGMRVLILEGSDFFGELDADYNASSIISYRMGNMSLSGNLPDAYVNSRIDSQGNFDPNGEPNPKFPTGAVLLEFHNNNLEGSFIKDLSVMFRPRYIDFRNNNLSGPLPVNYPEAMDSDNFAAIQLSGNNFDGTIPLAIGNIRVRRNNFFIDFANNNLSSYEQGAFAPVVFNGSGNYISGLRTINRIDLQGNSLTQGELDKIVLDMWANVQSRLGTKYENWGSNGRLNIQNQSTGDVPSYSNQVNAAILGLQNAGYIVQYDGWASDERTIESPYTPQLNYPSHESMDVSILPTLKWSDSGAELYIIDIYENSVTEPIYSIEISNTTITLNEPLDYSTDYSWRIRAIKNGIESEWSNEWKFTTIEKSKDDNYEGADSEKPSKFPDAPTQYGPENRDVEVPITPEFTWSNITADYYILHVSRRNPGGMFIDVVVTDTTYTPDEILGDNAIHDWRVRGVKDGKYGEWSEIRRFTTNDEGLPNVAGLISPGHFEQEVDVFAELAWEDKKADSYEIRLIHKKTSEILFTDESVTSTYIPEAALPDTTEFVWQVKSISDGVKGAWGPRWEFSTGVYSYIVEAPSLIAPDKGTEYDNLTPVFEWQAVDADHYIILVSKEKPSNAKTVSGASVETIDIIDQTEETVYIPQSSLDPETVYYWRVQAVRDGEEGEWSEVWEFKTPAQQKVYNEPGGKPLQTELSQNYPNPFNPTTQIEFTLSDVQNVTLRVYDMAGRQIATLVEEVMQAGRHTATFNASHLASGVYFYRFVSNKHQFTRKMTLVK